jgi:A/G-specific adenine glycosylase
MEGTLSIKSPAGRAVVHFGIVIQESKKQRITRQILAWYRANARRLPWRETSDPYSIWISEIMLQQTRVETVIPYYQRWLEEFPSLEDLAEADENRVLKAWEGLGYYSRARNLLKAACILVEQHGGELPRNLKTLQSLPGIGRYTAGAVASIAFNIPAPILDGNLRRVFTRLFNISSPLKTAETEKMLWKIAEELLPETEPGDFNQALMELGALVCLPTNPNCESCPLAQECLAHQLGVEESRPVRKAKDPLPHYQVAAAVIEKDRRVLLAKRPPDGLLGGLWEFPGGKQEGAETFPETLRREIREELDLEIEVGESLGTYHHAYTHYRVTLQAFRCKSLSDQLQLNYHTEISWVKKVDLETFPMGKLDRLIADQLQD